jgi:hypothetical protein
MCAVFGVFRLIETRFGVELHPGLQPEPFEPAIEAGVRVTLQPRRAEAVADTNLPVVCLASVLRLAFATSVCVQMARGLDS